jgi:hypothetical protein
MDRRLRIYVAWTPEHLFEAARAAGQLVQAGHRVIMETCAPEWTEADRLLVASCDCLVRWPGESTKSDFAVDCAKVLGLPVYFSLQACLNDLSKRAEVV